MTQRGSAGAGATSFDANYIIGHGILSGLIAGVFFIAFEMYMGEQLAKNAMAPFEAISAMVLGTGAMTGAYSVIWVTAVGLLVHFVIASFWGIIFVLLVSLFPELSSSFGLAILSGMVFGIVVWLIDFFAIAPSSFPWMAQLDQTVQFLTHTFFYGLPLGIYFGVVGWSRRRAA